jgi:DNA-binding transcriptional ArsR family regulator
MKPPRGLQKLDDLERVFKALAHPTRRHILVVLNARGGRMTAGEIVNRFSCTWPTTTRHLRILETAGLVTVDQKGREWIYTLNVSRLRQVAGGWLRWFKTESKSARRKK